MELLSHNLTAAKGYLFFDSAYVAISSNITCHSNNPVYTTVNNILLNGNVTVANETGIFVLADGNFTMNPLWVHHENTGYVFVDTPAPTVHIRKGPVSGNWINCGVVNETETLNTLTILIDNTDPYQTVQTAYVVFPNVEASEMPALADSMDGLQLAYASEVHAAINTTSLPDAAVMQAIFWEAGSVVFDHIAPAWNVTVDHACMLVVETDSAGATVTASNPNTPSLQLTVYLSGEFYGEGCTPGSGSTRFDMTLPQYFGNSTSITCLSNV
jgi:chondroitin AC lyase